MKPEIAFIGLGVMGRPMASHLARTYSVIAYDVDRSRLEGLTGVEAAGGLEDVSQAGVAILSLPSTQAVEAVVLGDGGLAEHLGPGSTVIDLSTTQPVASRRIRDVLSEKRIDFLDAPVSGGEKGAREASLSIMVGGAPEVFARHKDLLSLLGSSVVHVGDVGSGGIAKLVNNMIVAAAFTSIVEGFGLAARNDIDLDTLYRAIRGGWAGSKVLDVSAEAITSGDFAPGGTVELLWKDLGYARDLARMQDVPIPVTAAVDQVFVAGRAAGLGDLSQPSLIKLWEQVMGREIAGDGVAPQPADSQPGDPQAADSRRDERKEDSP